MGIQIDELPHSCGSKRGLKVFAQDDGSVDGYCFVCGKREDHPYGEPRKLEDLPKRKEKTPEQIAAEIAEVQGYQVFDLPHRKLRETTLNKFGAKISVSEIDGTTPTAIYWPVTKGGKLCGYHVKSLDKSFSPYNIGDTKGADLLNWENARQSGAYKLIVTEGPEDMASVDRIFELHGDKAYHPAVVSLPHGASSAKKALGAKADEIGRLFKEVILCFDDDPAGRKAVEGAMVVLPGAKSVILPAKDANAALVEGKAKAAYTAISFQAAAPKNTSLVFGSSLHESSREPAKYGYLSWPWPKMNDALRGIRSGETIYLGAG